MLRFFQKRNTEKHESDDSRLRTVEWKVNLVLVLAALQLILLTLVVVKQYLVPSTTTLALGGVASIGLIWFFRNQIPGMLKRFLFRSSAPDNSVAEKAPRREESIR